MTRIAKHVDTLITRLPAVISAASSPSMWALDRLHIDLYDNQIEIVDAICDLSAQKIAILQARGSGKSFATGVGLIKLCLDIPGVSIGIFGPKAEQATRIIKEIRTKILVPSCPVYGMVDNENSVNSRLVFKNGSYLQAISASVSTQNEGWHFHIAVIDEAHRVADIAVNQRIIPMLGSLPIAKIIKIGIAMYRNNFWKSCSGNGTLYKVFKRSWEDCPILLSQGSVVYKGKEYPKYVLDQMPLSLRRKAFPDRPDLHWDGPSMTEFDFKTNYSMEWLQDVDLELTEEEQTRLVSGTHPILKKAAANLKEQYFFGLDTASGSILPGRQDLDNTVLSIWRRRPDDVKEKVACYQWQGSVLDQIREIKQIINPSSGIFPCTYGLVDYSNIGISIVESFKAEGFPIEGIMYNVTEPVSRKNHKNAMFDHFKFELQADKIKYPSLEEIEKSTTFTQAFNEWCIIERHKGLGINDKIDAPSGSHDDHCFAGSTKIQLLDGTSKTIKELSDNLPADTWVYSIDNNQNIVPGRVLRAWKTGVKETVKVTLDNNESFECTPDHRIMLRDGTYKEAGQLQANDSVMPLYLTKEEIFKGGDYEFTYNPAEDKYIATHRLVMKGKWQKGQAIHHKNFNRFDNRPVNLEALDSKEHFKLHSRNMTEINKRVWSTLNTEQRSKRLHNSWEKLKELRKDPNYRARCIKASLEGKKEYLQSGERSRASCRIMKQYWAAFSKEERSLKNQETQKKAAAARKGKPSWKRGLTTETDIRVKEQAKKLSETRKKLFASGKLVIYNKGLQIAPRTECIHCAKVFRVSTHPTAKNLYCSHTCMWAYRRLHKLTKFNHKVIKVERAALQEVYDLEVDTYHNFALTCGVFVHNCNADVLAIWCMDKVVSGTGTQRRIINLPSPISGPASVSGRGISTQDTRKSGFLDGRPLSE